MFEQLEADRPRSAQLEIAHRKLPPGTMAKQRFSYTYDPTTTGGYEWVYLLDYIMPQLEENNFFAALDGPRFDVMNPWYSPSTWPSTVNGVPIATLMCPSDLGPGAEKHAAVFPTRGVRPMSGDQLPGHLFRPQ